MQFKCKQTTLKSNIKAVTYVPFVNLFLGLLFSRAAYIQCLPVEDPCAKGPVSFMPVSNVDKTRKSSLAHVK